MKRSIQKHELGGVWLLPLLCLFLSGSGRAQQAGPSPVYVLIWFDTEDYILSPSDDAAKRLADFLTAEGVHATFKVVGEKTRTLERRDRNDVIAALGHHDIGYHGNTHSQHPTPAEYESSLDWNTGVEELTRRERPGFEDVLRIFGKIACCYGQPGNSWAPQSFNALRHWGVNVYLDEGSSCGSGWRLKSFDEFLERRFPESRRKAYYLMSIHEHLPPEVKRELKQVGWTKGLELAKLARSRNGQEFDCATWLHKAREMPKEQFQREVEKELTGRETEAWEIIYFKLYKSQIPVIEQALETAALMLGSDKSRGYCLEMICADFLAGANLNDGDPDILLRALSRSFHVLPTDQQQAFLQTISEQIQ